MDDLAACSDAQAAAETLRARQAAELIFTRLGTQLVALTPARPLPALPGRLPGRLPALPGRRPEAEDGREEEALPPEMRCFSMRRRVLRRMRTARRMR